MPYAISKPVVARSLVRLREQRTHPLFAGYLHLQYRSTQLGRLGNLKPDFLSYFKKFFQVADHPLGTPYIRVFTDQKASEKNLWLNENVAGSYAPSSLRPTQPFRQVVEVENKEYSLFPDHAELALEHLLYKSQVQIADLSTFLYRDYGLLDEGGVSQLVDTFAYEFGYSDRFGGKISAEFNTLFSAQSVENWSKDWLEPI